MSVFKTYLQDLDEAPVKLKSKVFAICEAMKFQSREIRMLHKTNRRDRNASQYQINIHNFESVVKVTLFAKHDTSLSASLIKSSMAMPSLLASFNS